MEPAFAGEVVDDVALSGRVNQLILNARFPPPVKVVRELMLREQKLAEKLAMFG